MILLQKFGFKDSRYERPQDTWVCGHLAEGRPCALGPGAGGRCRVTTACQPRLEGGRWECRRSQQEGGPCEGGPLPDGRCSTMLERCVPRRSLRAQRKRITLWASSLAVGLVALVLGGSHASILMPGPLSAPHAGQTECSTCHAGIGPGKLGWLHQLVASVGPKENSKLCTTCHDVGAQPFAPHTYPVDELQKMTAALKAENGGKGARDDSWIHFISFPGPKRLASTGEPEIFCATCHQEHNGVFHDLKAVASARCQTCHVSKFGSFADSHPAFTNYPFYRRTRIIFDHQSHFGTHFPKALETATPGQVVPKVCDDCHVPGQQQQYMQVKSFESMCASCHDGDIMGTTLVSGTKGIDFVDVPGLDVATLNERGIDIGDWPERSEAEPTAFMPLLLSSEGGEDVLAAVKGLDLLDLSNASDADLANVAKLAWAVKRLFHELETTPPSNMIAMQGEGEQTQMPHTEMTRLTGAIPHDVLMAANQEWFPNLDEDLQRHADGKPTSAFEKAHAKEGATNEETPPQPAENAAGAASGGAGTEAGGGGILAPSEGGGDNAAGGEDILGGSAGTGSEAGGGGPLTPAEGGSAGGGDILGSGGAAPSGEGGALAPAASNPAGGEDILGGGAGSESSDSGGGGPLAPAEGSNNNAGGEDILGGSSSDQAGGGGPLAPAESGANAAGSEDILSGSSSDQAGGGGPLAPAESGNASGGGDILGGGSSDQSGGGLLAPQESSGGPLAAPSGESSGETETAEAPKPPFDPESWADLGGWFRQDYTIRYRPTGHADRFLRTWLDISAQAFGTQEEPMLSPVFDRLTSNSSPGRCTKCHSIDDEAGFKNVKWHAFSAERVRGRFTIFSHAPHIGAADSKGCIGCHTLNPTDGDYLESYKSGDPTVFVSNFRQVTKVVCASCHTAKAAGEECTLCHEYHANQPTSPMVQTKLP